MTELAKTVSAPAASVRAFAGTLQRGKLKLPGDEPATVYVAPFTISNITVGGFGLTADGDFYEGGLKWKSGKEFSKFITFILLPGIKAIDCDELAYSPVIDSSETQLLAIMHVAQKMSYQFYVKFPDGSRHDPKIIVTPITHTDDDDADE